MRLLFLLLCLQAAAADAAPRVVTSITPLQELTATIMAGVGEPEVMIEGHASAHHFSFKPSHLQRLQQADLMIWIDRRFEAGFHRIVDILPATTRTLELLPLLEIDSDDGHIWYSPRLLIRVIAATTAQLSDLDPEHASHYRRNAEQLSAAVRHWREARLLEWQERQPRFIADHAFTTHFGADLGLGAIAAIHDHHDDHGGLKSLQHLEEQLRLTPASCLLSLEQPASALAQRLAQKYDLRIIDPSPPGLPTTAQNPVLERLDSLNSALRACD